MRWILTAIVMCCLSASTIADEPEKQQQAFPLPARTLTLSPRRIETLALRYPLLPPYLERTDANASPMYHRSLSELKMMAERLIQPNLWDNVSGWSSTPLDKLPQDKVRETLDAFRGTFKYAEIAARRTHCDWGLPLKEKKEDIFAILLPEIQDIRSIARLLALKARLEIARGEHDQALRTFQTAYMVALHTAEGPFLICDLVGNANASILHNQVITFISSPNAPNLYWSLTALPRPLIDLRDAIELEASGVYYYFPQLLAAKTKTLTAQQWEAELDSFIDKFERSIELIGGQVEVEEIKKRLNREEILARSVEAKAGLIMLGHPKDAAKQMPKAQAILLYTALIFDHFRDDLFKWSYVPYPRGREEFRKARQRLTEHSDEAEIVPVASTILPAIDRAVTSVTLRQREVEVMRIVEALRDYAAEHGNKFPESLADIKSVPIPDNPMTGKPFNYRLDGEDAVLETWTLKIAK